MGESIQSREELQAGYTRWQHRANLLAIVLFSAAAAGIAWGLWGASEGVRWVWPIALLAGLLVADWMSGMVHWLCDTWGSPDMPIVGRFAIRTFREHHVDPKAITRHDWIQTNGEPCVMASLGLVLLWPLWPQAGSGWGCLVATSWLFGVLLTASANQMHKWAHEARPNGAARALQRLGVILTPERHDRHHVAPHDDDYCITVGWLNAPLRRLGYFRALERVISKLTGARPRADDGRYVRALGDEKTPAARSVTR